MDEAIKIREPWIDLSKVILIYLMVTCHLGVSHTADTMIVSFHMSAFFLISGYLHKKGTWLVSMKKSIKRLLVPVLFFNILGYCVWCFQNSDIPFSVREYITKPILGIVMLDPLVARPMCMPMWFCVALFFAKSLSLACRTKRQQIIMLAGCFVAVIMFLNVKIGGGNFIGRIFLATVFYISGFLLKENVGKLLSSKTNFKILTMLLSFVFLCALALYNGRISWLNFNFGSFFILFIFTSYFGALFIFCFSSLVYKKDIFAIAYLSKNTMTILGIHLMLFPLLPQINHFISSLLILILCLPIIWILNRHVPILIGSKK